MTRLDKELLCAHVLRRDRSYVMAHDDEALSPLQEKRLRELLALRKAGVPVAYLTGHKEFYGLDFFVSPAVLIPKPDTETLVAAGLKTIENARGKKEIQVLDVCCGSGCVGISLLYNSPSAVNMIFSDISAAALSTARKNARHLLENSLLRHTRFILGDLFSNLEKETFDLITANPPYVSRAEAEKLLSDGRSEPLLALDGGETGIEFSGRLIREAKKHLKKGGQLLMEVGDGQAETAAALFRSEGYGECTFFYDLSGEKRVVGACVNEKNGVY